ncbi:phospholipase D family protein [Candidatus Pyrohabitans sp.]
MLALFPVAFAEQTVQGSGIIMGIEAEYDFKSPEHSIVTITYKFVNPEKEPIPLEYASSFTFSREGSRVIEVYDVPKGGVQYRLTEDKRGVTFFFGRTFAPGEEYEVKIKLDVPDATERGDGVWKFKDIEGNFFEWPINGIRVSFLLPESLFKSYKIVRLDPGAELIYEGQRKGAVWERRILYPGESYLTTADFTVAWNIHAIVLTLILAALLGAVGYFFYSGGRSRIVIRRGFIKTLPGHPGESDIISKLEESIRSAKHEVAITSPWIFYVDWFTSSIKQVADRGVKVRIITWPWYERRKVGNKWEYIENRRQSFALERFLDMFPPGTVKLNENVHSKLIIVDGKEVIASSANLTQTGFWENYEAGIWIEDEEIAKAAMEYFEKVWNSKHSVTLTREFMRERRG